MKILVFTENTHCGGLDTFLVTLINNWPQRDDQLMLLCNKTHPGLRSIRERLRRPCKVIAHGLPMVWSSASFSPRRRHSSVRRLLFWLMRYFYLLLYVVILPIYYQRLGADRLLVVNGGYPGGQSCRAASIAWGLLGRRPLSIHNFHNFARAPRYGERSIETIIDRCVQRFSRAVVSVSIACAESLSTRPGFKAHSKVICIYNGIESQKMNAERKPLRNELGLSTHAPMCLMLATYEPRKGHEFLLRAFGQVVREMPDARLVICGYGYPAEVERVRRVVDGEGLQDFVRLEGFRNDVHALLHSADVLLVPSQSYESFSLPIVEAMLHGVPVVATRVGGIPEVLGEQEEGGFSVDPDNVTEFARRILELLRNPALRKDKGDRGRRRFLQRFTAARMAAEYAELIRSEG